MTKRLFAFGCSFTSYGWPTWADIIGQNYDHYENWGRTGAGNHYIFNALIECIKRKNITADDEIAIMWTNVSREDRYIKGIWATPGNIYTQTIYRPEVVALSDNRGFYIRDLAFIAATLKILKSIGCRYYMCSMVPLTMPLQYQNMDTSNEVSDLLEAYKEELQEIRPSVYEKVFNFDWYSRPSDITILNRPDFTSWESMSYNSIKKESVFLTIVERLKNYDWKKPSQSSSSKRDEHPTPGEHLEYLDLVFPEITISKETRNWVNDIDLQVRSKKDITSSFKQKFMQRW